MTERYRTLMKDFLNLISVLDAFSIFNFDSILMNITSSEFSVYSHSKINVLSNVSPQDIEILGWCPAGLALPHGEKVPL